MPRNRQLAIDNQPTNLSNSVTVTGEGVIGKEKMVHSLAVEIFELIDEIAG